MTDFWVALGGPLTRVLIGLMAGLFVASLIEGLQLTRPLARLAAPLVRLAHMGPISGAAFALSMFSPSSANAMLGEHLRQGDLQEREVMLSNLFNSLPSWVTHTPSIFFMTWPVLGFPAVIYTGLTLAAAVLRTGLTILAGQVLLTTPDNMAEPALPECQKPGCNPWKQGLQSALTRFRKRLPRLVFVAIPIYIAIFYLQKTGVFTAMEQWLATHASFLSFLKPEALSIVVLYMAAELGAAVAAAGSVLHAGGLTTPDVVMALLIGNILSTPMRALRHQLPAYSAYFSPAMATKLVAANQISRALSIIAVAVAYWFFAF